MNIRSLFLSFRVFLALFALLFSSLSAQPAGPGPAPASDTSASTSDSHSAEDQARLNTNAAAAAQQQANKRPSSPATNFLQHLVDSILQRFDIDSSGNTPTRYVVAAVFLAAAILLRRLVIFVVFGFARKISARTKTTLDDKLFPTLEAPVSLLIIVSGIVAALKVLKLAPATIDATDQASTMAFSLAFFWLLLRAFSAILAHAEEIAHGRKLGIAAFMPWIKRTLITVFIIFGILMVAQSQGLNVRAFLAGLGIGGLAFALAAQDTLANLFGSVVVAIDQPFKLGEFVQIGSNSGSVEDIGLRSTKLRRADKSLIVIPNKTVAAEAIVNLSRFTQRRFEQNLGLTYDATPEQLDELVGEIRKIILAETEIDPASVLVNISDFAASSINIWVVYMTRTPDFNGFLAVRQRLNLNFMRAISARGLAFAFPTQTIQLDGEIARKMIDKPV